MIFWRFQLSGKFGSLRWCYCVWCHKTFKGAWISYSRREIWERNHESVRWVNNWEALKKPEKIDLKFLYFCKKKKYRKKLIINIRKSGYTVKPLYSGHPGFLK